MSAAVNRANHNANMVAIEFGKNFMAIPQSGRHLADLILKDTALFSGIGSPLLNAGSAGGAVSAVSAGSANISAPHNIDQIEAHLDSIAEKNPDLAAVTRTEIMASLSPAEQGQLLRVQDGIMKIGPDGQGFNFAEPGKGLSQEQWIADAKASSHPDYARYAALAGSEDVGAIKKAMDDVYAGRTVLPHVESEAGSVWYAINTTTQYMEAANTFGVYPMAKSFNQSVDANMLMKGSKLVGRAFNAAGLGAQYMENRAQGHSKFSSTVGAGSSTAGPIAAGALAGAGFGAVLGEGMGALPGAIVGAAFGFKYGDDMNKSGLTAAEFMDKKAKDFDATKIEDSKGVSLGDALNYKLMPKDIGRK